MLKIFNKMAKLSQIKEKKNVVFLLSFLLPFVMMLIIIIAKGVYPFGGKCILRTDFYHQYLPFYSELKYKLSNFRSLLYTYDVGLGTNFVTLFAYYLACPLNIFLFFVPQDFVLEFMTFMIVLKIALSGFAMSYYLVKRYKTESYFVIAFALLYAMSGYIGAYYWNIMWLDNIVIFPFLMLGFENVCNGKKPYLYIASLFLSILCNYYIGAITCFFLIIYFVFYNILKDYSFKKIINNFVHIGIYSIIGVMISGVLLLPVIFAFSTTASSDNSFPTQVREYFTIIEGIGRHLILSKSENGIEYWPNIYSGIICLPLISMYFLSKKYKIKEKICYAIIILFFLASFSINILDFTWHILKYPNSLPCRQSFIYTFLIICVSMKPLLKVKSLKAKDITYGFSIVFILLILLEKLLLSKKVEFSSFYISLLFLFIYFVIFIKFTGKKFNRFLATFTFITVIAIEVFCNMYITSIYTINRSDYMDNVKDIRVAIDNLKNKTNDFYRVERVNMKAKDDGAFIHFPSSSIFSSSSYAAGSDFYKSYGMEASTNAYSITGSTPFMDALLSVKYKIFESEPENIHELNLREIDKYNDVHLYQNIDTLPISFMLTKYFIDTYDKSSGNPATVQNNFSRSMHLDVMLDKKNVNIDGIKANLKIDEAGDYYAFVRDKGIKEVTVSYKTTSKQYKNMNRGYFIELGFLDAREDIEFRNDTNESDLLIEVFRFNYETFKRVVSELKSYADCDVIKYSDDHILYNMDVHKSGKCVLTLPYDKGLKVLVDDKVVTTEKTLDFLTGFDLDIGKHKIEVSYMPEGLREGIILTIIGILMFAIIIYRDLKQNTVR